MPILFGGGQVNVYVYVGVDVDELDRPHGLDTSLDGVSGRCCRGGYRVGYHICFHG